MNLWPVEPFCPHLFSRSALKKKGASFKGKQKGSTGQRLIFIEITSNKIHTLEFLSILDYLRSVLTSGTSQKIFQNLTEITFNSKFDSLSCIGWFYILIQFDSSWHFKMWFLDFQVCRHKYSTTLETWVSSMSDFLIFRTIALNNDWILSVISLVGWILFRLVISWFKFHEFNENSFLNFQV